MRLTKKRTKVYFDKLKQLEDEFYSQVSTLEKQMQKEVKNNEIEFFWVDGNVVGIGNADRTMKLIHR